ncbi:TadE family protein [Streptomyces anulatus]|uniref:Pilus assembly protein n=1 Tax=Streptomyces anulatus TaxID=1892 RepID=A0A7K3RMP9_STRAQ|nr:TadE family protein [Streptomyces anulatus]NEC03468.1 pilus assembly protein [Streptomyces anulatus]NED30827.1 pilus assembly protein [Streptomyces anulatus]
MTTTRTARSGIRGRITALRDRRYGGRVRGRNRDRGQTAVEFLGMTPFIILIMLVLWECALIGYTWSLAGNAADVGARKGSGAEYGAGAACRAGAMKDLPPAWKKGARIRCSGGSRLYEATVELKVPVLVPGLFDLDTKIKGTAGSPREN